MRLLVIRHATAEDPIRWTGDDATRPLTARGERRMRRAARGIARLVPDLDAIATSPLVRAVQTGAVLAGAYRDLPTVELQELMPGSPPDALFAWAAAHPEWDTIAAVGHEPAVSHTVSRALAGGGGAFVEFKKGAACLLDFSDDAIGAGEALLLWALTPRQLRGLGR